MSCPYPLGWMLAAMSAIQFLASACSGNDGSEAETPQPTETTATASATISPTSPTLAPSPTAALTATPSPTPTAPPSPTAVTAVLQLGERAVLTGLGSDPLHLRDGPGRWYAEVAHLLEGETVSLTVGPQTDTSGAYIWWQVELGDGSVGWIAEGPIDGSEHWLVPRGNIEALPFRSVAWSIQQAIDSRDADFFWRLAATVEVVCTDTVRLNVYGCRDLADGAAVGVLHVWNPWEGTSHREDQYKLIVSRWLAAGRPDTSDDYGSGAVRIHATSFDPFAIQPEYHAIVTGIIGSGSSPERDVIVFAWQLQNGAWRHTWVYIGEGWWDEGRYPPVAWLNGGVGIGAGKTVHRR